MVLSQDQDFALLYQRSPDQPFGVILLRLADQPRPVVNRVREWFCQTRAPQIADLADALVIVTAHTIRIVHR